MSTSPADAHDDDPTAVDDDAAELDELASRMRACLRHHGAHDVDAAPVLHDYTDLQPIQRGGQGLVYSARQVSTGRRVAIKRLQTLGLADGRSRKRFEREIEVATRLVHPNVVPVFDRGTTPDGDLYFVMEFIDGLPLDRFADDQQLGLPARVALFDRLCAAVSYAHRCGVVHRDLKPENVLVDATGEPRVLDFGLAKPADAPAAEAVTRAGEFLGTLAYAAPEQLSGDPDAVDARTDVYALGVLLYRLLCGRHPFPLDGSLSDVVRAVTDSDPPPPSRAAPGAYPDSDLDALCLTCLAKGPADRYASVDALRAELSAWRDGRPLAARAHHRGYVLRRTLARHRALVVAVLLVMTGLAVSSVVAWSALGDARQEARRAEHLGEFLVETLVAAEPGLNPRDVTLVQWLERARLDVGARFPGEPISEAAVRDAVGHVLRAAGEYAEADDEFELALGLLDDVGEGAGAQALATRLHLAQSLYEAGRWDEADALLAGLLDDLRHLDPSDREALRAPRVQVLAMLRVAQERPDEAVALLDEEIARARAAGHPDAHATLLPVLADALRGVGDLERALAAHVEAEALRSARFGAQHPSVQRLRQNRALVLAELGRFDEAVELLRDMAQQLERALGAGHPVTLQTRVNLASALLDGGQAAAARDLLLELVSACRQHLGERNRTTLAAMHTLGAALRLEERLDEAETLLRAARDGRSQLLGADSLGTLRSQIELGLVVGRRGRWDEAETLLRDAAERCRASLGLRRKTTFDAEHALAVFVMDMGRPEEAERIWGDMLPRAEAALGAAHENTALYRFQRGLVLARLGRLDEAVQVIEQAHLAYRELGEAQLPNRRATAALLEQVYGALGDDEQVRRWRAEALGAP